MLAETGGRMRRALLVLAVLPLLLGCAALDSAAFRAALETSTPTRAPTATVSPTATPERICTVTADALNVHSSACILCRDNIVDWLTRGERVVVLEMRGEVAEVRLPEGGTGFIAARYCK